ncbi:uncharacterized protein F5147DRAFT_775240 [Suillus discolor]|uniref:Uncharacterized protein n=1 Tax=Suillus discolor TaxID=1912936 RepID=A0A9P7F4Q5_9AGAM|nr:uncharacterized protein F5147DRAFT_775240 [Suillus discolor]KAG2105471.1 hypothetical protein F5147DRAFT_775240 [Suillus discolor]
MGQRFDVTDDSQFDAQAGDGTNLDRDLFNTAGNLPPSNKEWYEGAAKCYPQDGATFLDLFDANEYAEYRKENLFYPFASREEWEVADFLLRSALSMAAIDTFLQLSMPLMKAAELGIMMADPVGNICHCFTPLAAYIVDTPEACMLACVRGKTSPFTMASYLQFRDNFRHPTRTCAITLEQLTSIDVDPNNLEAFFAACAEFWLNGVFAPFWKGWRFSDPTIFLTPEALHHWHKQFYDHNLQWCLAVLGVPEFDFRISILQPITGYHHFSSGISKLKQVTDRVHRDIQRYIVGLIAGAAPRRFVIAIRALMDVRYLGQSPAPDDDSLAFIDRSLAIFHDNKDVIMTLGAQMGTKRAIDNWHIPKLELMQSITTSARQVGALIQWSVDATEHAHITEIKDPARHTNNNDYDPQICRHLDREEKLHRFAIATTLKSPPTHPDLEELHEDEGDKEEDKDKEEEENGEINEPMDLQSALLQELNHMRTTSNYFCKIRSLATARHDGIPQTHPPRTFLAGSTTVHLNCNPTRCRDSCLSLCNMAVFTGEYMARTCSITLCATRSYLYMRRSFPAQRAPCARTFPALHDVYARALSRA